ncbi:hypothetical protein CFC21_001209 [Triticum aestivum]|uniref:aspartate--tRNA ligase n=2 Tax=Triticum aestivum TaxID=4565 RepID=A0A3B5XWL5_WHEAT|nr:hypothetical protein CFC21_001209 [Triticum aestivum]
MLGKKGEGTPTAAPDAKNPYLKQPAGENAVGSRTASADETSDGEQLLSLSEALYSKSYGDVPVEVFMTVPVRRPLDRLNLADISREAAGRIVLVQGFAQTIKKVNKNITLVVLREGLSSIKCVVLADDPGICEDMVTFIRKLNKESFVEVEGLIETMRGTQQIRVKKLYCIDEAGGLPFQLEDAARGAHKQFDTQGKKLAHVSLSVRLNSRFFDLRIRVSQAVFWIQSEVTTHFMQFMIKGGFMCTHTPKITGVSEGGSAVFKVNYFKEQASLAQSPQLYKQMLINGGINRVFEVGPVYRAEDSNTHRHLCEYIGLHAEMQIKEHYFEVIDFVDALFVDLFDHLAKNCSEMLDIIQEQYPCERLKYLQQNVRLKYSDGIKMLQESGFPIQEPQDLNNKAELMLGKLVLEKYKTDFFILYEFPLAVRPFYTMPSGQERNPGSYSNSFDAYIRGQEVLSGSQRIHNKSLLIKRIDERGYIKAIFQQFTDTFGCGAPPRGGFGAGLERLVMLYLGVPDIRIASLFPRDPGRLVP